MDEVTKRKLLNLQVGYRIKIENINYCVEGVIRFEDADSKWVEYKLSSIAGIAWLNVEEAEEIEVSLYQTKFLKLAGYGESSLEYGGKIYYLTAEGRATIYRSKGDVDVEINDQVQYYEYTDQIKQELLVVEVWEDEVEISLGRWVKKIEILAEKVNQSGFNDATRDGLILGGLILIGIIGFLVWIFRGSIAKKIEKAESFQYLTSINSYYESKDRAQVYSTDSSVTQTNTKLQSMEFPEAYSELNQPQLQLVYPDYYVIIYEGFQKTMLQISSRKYIYQNGYARIYGAKDEVGTKKYLNELYLASDYYQEDHQRYSLPYDTYHGERGQGSFIRLHSTTVRNSSGGGISFGK